jgi:hypothetical protein
MSHLTIINISEGHIHKYEDLKRKMYNCNANIYFNQKLFDFYILKDMLDWKLMYIVLIYHGRSNMACVFVTEPNTTVVSLDRSPYSSTRIRMKMPLWSNPKTRIIYVCNIKVHFTIITWSCTLWVHPDRTCRHYQFECVAIYGWANQVSLQFHGTVKPRNDHPLRLLYSMHNSFCYIHVANWRVSVSYAT